ncbi:hypothetical protein HK097_002755 [Rhizophlyctis rosea]|uniref:J domain-containing protein n=1 Tax=Rhizophlyctis rosea TaxID=64517 RepID=A0AAD5SIB7_9FUNG|nr:hypothetical protein HK097_002755 [Rhizophlyctis rosea]
MASGQLGLGTSIMGTSPVRRHQSVSKDATPTASPQRTTLLPFFNVLDLGNEQSAHAVVKLFREQLNLAQEKVKGKEAYLAAERLAERADLAKREFLEREEERKKAACTPERSDDAKSGEISKKDAKKQKKERKKAAKKLEQAGVTGAEDLDDVLATFQAQTRLSWVKDRKDIEQALDQLEETDDDRDSDNFLLPWSERNRNGATHRLLCHFANVEHRRTREHLNGLDQEELSLKARLDEAHEALSDVARKKFRTLAVRLHPDKLNRQPTDEEYNLLLEIQTAYQVLTDPELRRQYIQMNNHSMFLATLPKLTRDKEQEDRLMQYRKKAGIKRAPPEQEGERRRLTGGLPHKCTVPQVTGTFITNGKRGDQKVCLSWTCSSALEMNVDWYELQMNSSMEDQLAWKDIYRGPNTTAWTEALAPGHYSFRARGKNNLSFGEWSSAADLYIQDLTVARHERREQAERNREARRIRFIARIREQAEAIVDQVGNVPTSERLARLSALVDHLKRNRCEDAVPEVETMADLLRAKLVKSEEHNRWRTKLSELTKAVLKTGGDGKIAKGESEHSNDDYAILADLGDDDEGGDQDREEGEIRETRTIDVSESGNAISDLEAFIIDVPNRYPLNTALALPPSTRNQIVQAIKTLVRSRPTLSIFVDYLEADVEKAVTVKGADVYRRIMAIVDATKLRASYLGGQAKTGELAQHVTEKMLAECDGMEKARVKKVAEIAEKRQKREEAQRQIEVQAAEREKVAAFARGESIKKEDPQPVRKERENQKVSDNLGGAHESQSTPVIEKKSVSTTLPAPAAASTAPKSSRTRKEGRSIVNNNGGGGGQQGFRGHGAANGREPGSNRAWSINRVTPRKKKGRQSTYRPPVAPAYSDQDEFPNLEGHETVARNRRISAPVKASTGYESASPETQAQTAQPPQTPIAISAANDQYTPSTDFGRKPASSEASSAPAADPLQLDASVTSRNAAPVSSAPLSNGLGTPPLTPGATKAPIKVNGAVASPVPSIDLRSGTAADQQQPNNGYPTFGSFPQNDDLDVFLRELGISQQCIDTFHAHGVLYDDLVVLTEQDLTALGIKRGPLRRLEAAIGDLKNKTDSEGSSEEDTVLPATIAEWLFQLRMEDCEDRFHEQEIVLADLPMLTEEDLDGLIEKIGQRRRAKVAIGKMKAMGASLSLPVVTHAMAAPRAAEQAPLPVGQAAPPRPAEPNARQQQKDHVYTPAPPQYVPYMTPPPVYPHYWPAAYPYVMQPPMPAHPAQNQRYASPPLHGMQQSARHSAGRPPNGQGRHGGYAGHSQSRGNHHMHHSHQQTQHLQQHGHRNEKVAASILAAPANPTSNHATDSVPRQWLCALTNELMENPVRGPDGATYDEVHIRAYLSRTSTWRSPVTEVTYPPHEWNRCISQIDYVLRTAIQHWKRHQQSNGYMASQSPPGLSTTSAPEAAEVNGIRETTQSGDWTPALAGRRASATKGAIGDPAPIGANHLFAAGGSYQAYGVELFGGSNGWSSEHGSESGAAQGLNVTPEVVDGWRAGTKGSIW